MPTIIDTVNSDPYKYASISSKKGIKIVVKRFVPDMEDLYSTAGPKWNCMKKKKIPFCLLNGGREGEKGNT